MPMSTSMPLLWSCEVECFRLSQEFRVCKQFMNYQAKLWPAMKALQCTQSVTDESYNPQCIHCQMLLCISRGAASLTMCQVSHKEIFSVSWDCLIMDPNCWIPVIVFNWMKAALLWCDLEHLFYYNMHCLKCNVILLLSISAFGRLLYSIASSDRAPFNCNTWQNVTVLHNMQGMQLCRCLYEDKECLPFKGLVVYTRM